MKLIIDIDEKYYNDICNSETAGKYSVLYALNGIRNGIPLEQIKTDIENLSKGYHEYTDTGEQFEYLDREEVLQILDEYIKENK